MDFIEKLVATIGQTLSDRRKARRNKLRDGVDQHLKPLIRELGFESARTRAWRGSAFREQLQGWDWVRFREADVDLLEIRWEKYGRPYFIINYGSQDLKAWKLHSRGSDPKFGDTKPGHFPITIPIFRWFGEGQSADRAVELALIRLRELDAYMKGGPMTRYIWDQHKDPAFATARTSDQTPDDQA